MNGDGEKSMREPGRKPSGGPKEHPGGTGQAESERVRRLAVRTMRAEERFADIAGLVSDWIWEADREFRFTFVSARAGELLGYHPHEINGADLFAFGRFIASDKAGVSVPDRRLRAPFKDALYQVSTPAGEERLCLLSGVPVFSELTGAFAGFRGTARDVTDELEARAEASRSQTRLKDAVESLSEGFVLYDAKGRLVLYNRRIREFWSAIAHRLVPGAEFAPLVRAGARMVARPGAAAFAKKETWRRAQGEGGLEVLLKDGRWLRIEDRVMGDGSIVSIHTDITATKQREEALQVARQTAERANRAKSAFLANVSHELRTPLNAIIGFSEIMRDKMLGPIGNPAYEEYNGSVLESAYHLLEVINDILDVAKAEAGKLELEEADVNLGPTVASVLRLVADQARRNELEIVASPLDGLPLLYADERRLKQILFNLLSNAIKFTSPCGRIEVRAGRDTGGGLFIAVADNGIGIAPEQIADALAPFGQLDNSLSRKFAGTGLGLPLSRALAELHGGSLELASAPGVGTTVTVRFPKARVRSTDEASGNA